MLCCVTVTRKVLGWYGVRVDAFGAVVCDISRIDGEVSQGVGRVTQV